MLFVLPCRQQLVGQCLVRSVRHEELQWLECGVLIQQFGCTVQLIEDQSLQFKCFAKQVTRAEVATPTNRGECTFTLWQLL